MMDMQELSDRMELSMLLDRYAGAIDRVDMELLDTVFTPDAWVDYTAFEVFGGFAGPYPVIREWLHSGLSQSAGHQHINANREIEIDGNRATGRILCLNPMVRPRDGDPADRTVGMHGLWYIDTYVRTDAGWRIASRKEERCFSFNFGDAISVTPGD